MLYICRMCSFIPLLIRTASEPVVDGAQQGTREGNIATQSPRSVHVHHRVVRRQFLQSNSHVGIEDQYAVESVAIERLFG